MAKCMQCGGAKKTPKALPKKMAKGGSTANKLNNARGFAPAQKGGSNTKMMIYGIPNAGMTGPNRNSQTETMKKGGAKKSTVKKSIKKYQTGSAVNEYDRNIARVMDADKELNYIMDSAYGRANERISNANRKYSGTGRTRISEGAPENLGVRSPYATDADMAAYDKEIAAFYKANPGMKPYVGTLKPKAATTIKKKGGAIKKMAKGGSTFPDLTGDGKVTQADILKGRGVDIKKKGGAMKAKFGASVKVQRSPKAGKVRSASAQGYASVGKREPGRVIKKVIGKKK